MLAFKSTVRSSLIVTMIVIGDTAKDSDEREGWIEREGQ